MSSFSYPLTHVVLFIFSSHSHPVSFARARILHLSPSFVFLLVLLPPPLLLLLLLLFGVNGFTYLQVFFSRGRVSASFKKHTYLPLFLYIYLVLTLTYSLTHSFFLSFSPAKLLKHRQVKYCITIVLVWSKSNIFQPVWRYVAFWTVSGSAPGACTIPRGEDRRIQRDPRELSCQSLWIRLRVSRDKPRTLVLFACPRKKREKVRRNRLIIKNTYGGIDETLRWLPWSG